MTPVVLLMLLKILLPRFCRIAGGNVNGVEPDVLLSVMSSLSVVLLTVNGLPDAFTRGGGSKCAAGRAGERIRAENGGIRGRN